MLNIIICTTDFYIESVIKNDIQLDTQLGNYIFGHKLLTKTFSSYSYLMNMGLKCTLSFNLRVFSSKL